MRKHLFWLSDAQWAQMEPHLPTDVHVVLARTQNVCTPTPKAALRE